MICWQSAAEMNPREIMELFFFFFEQSWIISIKLSQRYAPGWAVVVCLNNSSTPTTTTTYLAM